MLGAHALVLLGVSAATACIGWLAPDLTAGRSPTVSPFGGPVAVRVAPPRAIQRMQDRGSAGGLRRIRCSAGAAGAVTCFVASG